MSLGVGPRELHSGLLSLIDFGATLDGGNSGDEVEMVTDVLAFLRPLSTPTLKETRGERISIHNWTLVLVEHSES